MTKQREARGWEFAGTETRLPPGRAGALWPGGGPGRCVVAAGGGGEAAGREGGRREDRDTSASRWLTG